MDETMEVKNVEMFPNDDYIGDIIDAAKSFRFVFSVFLTSRLNGINVHV